MSSCLYGVFLTLIFHQFMFVWSVLRLAYFLQTLWEGAFTPAFNLSYRYLDALTEQYSMQYPSIAAIQGRSEAQRLADRLTSMYQTDHRDMYTAMRQASKSTVTEKDIYVLIRKILQVKDNYPMFFFSVHANRHHYLLVQSNVSLCKCNTTSF